MAKADKDSGFPDGIGRDGLDPGIGGWWSVIRLVAIGGLLLPALVGLLGTGELRPVVRQTPAARIVVETPSPLRNGMFFETRVSVRPSAPVADLVIAFPAGVWDDVTINTTIPAPAEERFERGFLIYRFGPLAAGETLTFKIDGQINPSRRRDLAGNIEARDGGRLLAKAPYDIKVIG